MVKWNIDAAHTNIGFEVKHMMVSKVRGAFDRFESKVEGDLSDLSKCKIFIEIDVDSINTKNEDRDNHLRSADFFDVEEYPKITFHSTEIHTTDEDEFDIYGEITIKDVTKEIVFEAEFEGKGVDPWGNEVIGFSAQSSLSREEFGLTWNQALETGGVLVGDKIKISLDVEANPAKE